MSNTILNGTLWGKRKSAACEIGAVTKPPTSGVDVELMELQYFWAVRGGGNAVRTQQQVDFS